MTLTAPAPAATIMDEAAAGTVYRLGCLTDALRDSCATLLAAHPDNVGLGTVTAAAERYTQLRAALAGTVPDPLDLMAWTQDLDTGTDLAGVYTAAAGMAQYVDTLFNVRAFALGWTTRERQLATAGVGATVPVAKRSATDAGATGQYL